MRTVRRRVPVVLRRASAGLALGGLSACATAEPPAPPAPLRVQRVGHAPSAFGPGASRLAVDVRLASDADVAALAPPPGQVGEVLEISGAILLASGVLAVIGCPICLSNAVVAAGIAVVGVPVVAATSAMERHEQGRVEQALIAGDLPAQVRNGLARLRPAAPVQALPGEPTAELLLVGYGFANAGEHGTCFFVDARLRVGVREDALLLGPWRRSDDAPAPHCATRAQLAADHGALTTRVVAESGEILAGMVARRLEESP